VPSLSREDYENVLAFRTRPASLHCWSETQARAAGLTPAQHQLLVAIKGHPGSRHPTISDLAGYLCSSAMSKMNDTADEHRDHSGRTDWISDRQPS
jgi:hypothetical protein